jgi:hypothetical protein
VPVFLTYVARGGLNNQLYTHLNMLGLARALNATLILAPAQRRTSFEIKAKFSKDSIETLLDLDAMAAYWQPKGVQIASKVGIWCCRTHTTYITLQDFDVHGANRTHGTGSKVFRGIGKKFTIHRTASTGS